MNPTVTMLRWYRQSIGRPAPQQQYTAEEVLQLLRPRNESESRCTNYQDRPMGERDARGEAVHQVAARPCAWLDRLTKRQRWEIGPLADRLPSLVFHHATGGDAGELMQRFGGWSTWRYERALEVAGTCIANHLNDPR